MRETSIFPRIHFKRRHYSSSHSQISPSKQEDQDWAYTITGMGLGARTKRWINRLRGRNKEEEVQQLRPVALAGASRKSCGRSTLCSSFATTVTNEELAGSFRRSKAVSDGVATDWKQCHTCARHFLRFASKYKNYCSIDCKSVSLSRGSFS